MAYSWRRFDRAAPRLTEIKGVWQNPAESGKIWKQESAWLEPPFYYNFCS